MKISLDKQAQIVCEVMLNNFNQHLINVIDSSKQAKQIFSQKLWHKINDLRIKGINFYDNMVHHTVDEVRNNLKDAKLNPKLWLEIKDTYIKKIYNHLAPELAETFYNSVFCRLYDRRYYDNNYIFVQPVVSTKYVDIVGEKLAYQCYDINDAHNIENWQQSLKQILLSQFEQAQFKNLDKDTHKLAQQFIEFITPFDLDLNFHLRILKNLLFRNKVAYLAGSIVNSDEHYGFVLMLNHNKQGIQSKKLITAEKELDFIFSSSRAYFAIECEIPSASVSFLSYIVPHNNSSELYSMIGFHKQAKAEFYRDFLYHIKHSNDKFIPAPGIKGMVMAVFTLPSYPFVFKVIRDNFDRQKDISKNEVRHKYQMIKFHNRAGRMIDTMEFSHVAFPLDRFSDELLDYLNNFCANSLEISKNQIVISHMYIEKRLIPLNIYLKQSDVIKKEKVIIDYGDAIKGLARNNIFVGDMFIKNFGVSPTGKVVLYDYDDVEYLNDCHFRKIPENSDCFFIGDHDVFPEQFIHFFFSDKNDRTIFVKNHQDLLDVKYWQKLQSQLEVF